MEASPVPIISATSSPGASILGPRGPGPHQYFAKAPIRDPTSKESEGKGKEKENKRQKEK